MAISAVGFGSMSSRFCSTGSPPIPLPTIFSSASTRVCERSITRSLKSGKLRQPELPASTTVVTPAAKRESVGIDAVVAVVSAAPAGARVDVHMDIHQAGRDIQSGHIDHLVRLRRRDIRGDFGDLAVLNGDIANRADFVLSVYDLSALEQQIVILRPGGGNQKRARHNFMAGIVHRTAAFATSAADVILSNHEIAPDSPGIPGAKRIRISGPGGRCRRRPAVHLRGLEPARAPPGIGLAPPGVDPGDRVAVLAPNTIAALEVHFGVILAGAVLVMLNTRLQARELEWILNHCGAKVLLADPQLLPV